MATDIQIGKKRRFTATFTDDAGRPAAVDTNPTASVTDPAIGSIEDLVSVLNPSGQPIGCSGALRIGAIGPVAVHVTAPENGTPITLIGEANGIEGTVVGGRFEFAGSDEA